MGRYFLFLLKAKTLVVPSQMGPQEHSIQKQYVIPSQAGILSHLRFYLKGLLRKTFSLPSQEDLPQGESETSCLLTFLWLPPYMPLMYFSLFGKLLYHSCWYLCKGTITKYISLCLFCLWECLGKVTQLLGLRQRDWPAKTVEDELYNYDLIIT